MAKSCTYTYKGKIFNSELELDNFLQNLNMLGEDIVFQSNEKVATLHELQRISSETASLQEAYQKAKEHPIYLDGEDELKFDFPYIGVTSFLRGLTNSDGDLLTPEFREKEYWKKRISEWKDSTKGFNSDEEELFGKFSPITDTVTESELEEFLKDFEDNSEITSNNQILQLIGEMKRKWKAQGEMGTAIHDVLRHLFSPYKSGKKAGTLRVDDSPEQLISLFFKGGRHYNSNYLTEQHIRDIIEYAKQLKTEMIDKFGEDLTFFPEFQISSKLQEEIPGKGDTVLGIIDLLVVDSQGVAHVIDYKASPKDTFNSAKERGFWYQLGLYNRMLQANNVKIGTGGNQVLVAPIKMKGFRKEGDRFLFDGVEKRDKDTLSDITVYSTLHEVKKNLDEFVPRKPEISYTPQDIITNMTKFEATVFPNISTSKTWNDENIKRLIDNNGGIIYDSKTKKYIFKPVGMKSFSGDSESAVYDAIYKYFTETLPNKNKDYVNHVLIALRKGIKENTTNIELPKIGRVDSNSGASAEWFRNIISKYCNLHHEIIESPILQEYGVILIKNKKTNQINVLKITTDSLDFKQYFDKKQNRKLITGAVESDRVQMRKPNSLAFESDNGNIHLMETMAILNCIPSLLNGAIIGEVLVANPLNLQGRSASSKELEYNFNELASHVDDYKNNLKDVKFASMVDLASNRLTEIMSVGTEVNWNGKYSRFKQFTSIKTGLDAAISEQDERRILRQLEELRKELEKRFSSEISLELSSYNENQNMARSLYNRVMLAIAETKGIAFRQQTRDNANVLESVEIVRNGVQSLMLDNPGNLNNDTLNNLTKLVSEAYQNVREDMQRELGIIRGLVKNLKEDKNFNKIIEMTGGNAANLFKNMIEY